MDEKINYRGGKYHTSLLQQVRELRKGQTETEDIFWEIVRNRNFLGLKFRRQHQIGPYVVDFFCPEKNLIIEIDGGIHREINQKQRDISREHYFKELGFKVLRFWNREIENGIDIVIRKIADELS